MGALGQFNSFIKQVVGKLLIWLNRIESVDYISLTYLWLLSFLRV